MTAFHKLTAPVITILQLLCGKITLGVRAIVLNSQHQVLLVKHTYQPHWYLPGGGVKKGETVITAVVRELREEVGIIPNERPTLFEIYYHRYLGGHDYPIIFIVKNYHCIKANSPEIEAVGWFSYDNLPQMISAGTKRRLVEYFAELARVENW